MVSVPPWVADEIEDAARRTQRSAAFIVRRALGTGQYAHVTPDMTAVKELAIAVDEDDPADALTKIKSFGQARPLGEAVAAAWETTRARFHAWIAREEDAQKAEQADDLDRGLADARGEATSPDRLSELAKSEYPRVRALIAAHLAAPMAVLERLAEDRERTVRAAVSENPRTPADLRARIKV